VFILLEVATHHFANIEVAVHKIVIPTTTEFHEEYWTTISMTGSYSASNLGSEKAG
jgi:hypothetical protein